MSVDQVLFYTLLRAGLWEYDIQLASSDDFNLQKVFKLAEEQSVVGLVIAGIEHVRDMKVPQASLLRYIGSALQIEKRNEAMNHFLEDLVLEMRASNVYALLVKGQGVAQCYERPLWRSCGDVDFFLNNDDYSKAKKFLIPKASVVEKEMGTHLGMTIDSWEVELHGSLHSGLSNRIDRVMDNIMRETFYDGKVRSWQNGKTQIFMLAVENDVLYVFNHFLKHFYKEGLGIRQICDWCRLLWTYRDELNVQEIETKLRQMRVVSEWRAFAAYAVDYLGMPAEAMPLYSPSKKWKRKAKRINTFILQVGNMGHNRDMSYFSTKPYLIRKFYSMRRRLSDILNHARIFPLDSLRFLPKILFNGVKSVVKGE